MADPRNQANEETRSDDLGKSGHAGEIESRTRREGPAAGGDRTAGSENPDDDGTCSRVLFESVAFWQAIHSDSEAQTVAEELGGDRSLEQILSIDPIRPVWIGPYKIEEKIGEGGFSRIYAARHRVQPDRVVAIKIFRRLRLSSWQRLQVEALVLSRFDHPNLVSVLDAGELPDGTPYLVMNRVDGVSLDKYLGQRPLNYTTIARLFRDIAMAVQHAHDRDVVHRDLKPSNIMVRPDGQPVVIDFGLAKRLELSQREQSLTASHAMVGTLGYLAPEQAQVGKREITRAVDVYGLGATLYFALTGRPPLDRSDFWRAVTELKSKEPDRPCLLRPEIPSDLELICLKCLEKRPGDRYESLQDMADDLERFARGRSVTVRPSGWLRKQVRWCQANPLVAGLAAMIFVSVTAGLISTALLWRQADYRWRQSQVVLAQAEEILKTGVNSAEKLLPQTAGALEYRHQQLQQTLNFRQRLNALLEPEQVNLRSVAVLRFLLGKVCCRRGLFTEGNEHFQAALADFQALLAADPRDERLRFDVFHAMLGLESAYEPSFKPTLRPRPVLQDALAVIQSLVDDYPENKSYQDALACNLLLLSGVYREEDPVASRGYAEQSYREAVELKRQLPAPCLEWRHVGTAAGAMAETCLDANDWDGAESWLDISQQALEDFLQRPDRDPGEWMDLAGCWLLRRRVALGRGDSSAAQMWQDRWRELLETSVAQYPDYHVFAEQLRNAETILAVDQTVRQPTSQTRGQKLRPETP